VLCPAVRAGAPEGLALFGACSGHVGFTLFAHGVGRKVGSPPGCSGEIAGVIPGGVATPVRNVTRGRDSRPGELREFTRVGQQKPLRSHAVRIALKKKRRRKEKEGPKGVWPSHLCRRGRAGEASGVKSRVPAGIRSDRENGVASLPLLQTCISVIRPLSISRVEIPTSAHDDSNEGEED
jgi:hypothetical protein